MESTVKVHRKHRQRPHNSTITSNNSNNSASTSSETTQIPKEADETASNSGSETILSSTDVKKKQKDLDMAKTSKAAQQQTVLLVNGELPKEHIDNSTVTITKPDQTTIIIEPAAVSMDLADAGINSTSTATSNSADAVEAAAAVAADAAAAGGGGGNGSSRNSSGDAMSLRETLQQLTTPTVNNHHHHRSRHNRTHSGSPHSPQSPMRYRSHETVGGDCSNSGSSGSLQQQRSSGGIHSFIDRELKHSSPTSSGLSAGNRKLQSLSDPTGSPVPRSLRSRSSLERSPRRKRSKSESRRRRERKLIAAGEMEVRQANETLMRYLKQCSEINDASLSGELEIDENYDERRVQRKTKSQRDKTGHLMNKLVTAGGLTSILKELSDDIVPAEGEEIYNPFTPVVSPTEEDTPAHVDKMFMQTSSGYRQLEQNYYRHNHLHQHHHPHANANDISAGGDGSTMSGRLNGSLDLRSSESRGLLDGDCRRRKINTNIQLACVVQRIWLLVSNICHGLLAGLALAHLLFIVSSHPLNWSQFVNALSTEVNSNSNSETNNADNDNVFTTSANILDTQADANQLTLLEDYASFAHIYLNTFYCLAIICLVSVLDRMDICRWDFSNATEYVSFRWLIITMIYTATIILTICSDSIDDKLYFHNNLNVTLTEHEMISNRILSVWSSFSVTRSIGAICGWIMIGLAPHEDMLYAHLLDLTKYQMPQN